MSTRKTLANSVLWEGRRRCSRCADGVRGPREGRAGPPRRVNCAGSGRGRGREGRGNGLVGLSGGWLAQGGSLCHRQRWCALRAGGGGRGRHGERAAGQGGGEIGFQISGISEVAVVKCRLTTDSVAATCKPGLQVEMSAARVAPTVKLFKIAVFVKLHPAAGKPGLPTATASRTGEYAMTNYSLNRYQSDCWKVSERVCCVTPRRASPHPGSFTSSQRPSMCRTIVPVVE